VGKNLGCLRRIRPVIFVMAVIAGLLLGWMVIGWWLWPVEWTDTDPWDLRLEHQEAFVGLIARELCRTQDLPQIQSTLVGWDGEVLSQLLATLEARALSPEQRQCLAALRQATELPVFQLSLSQAPLLASLLRDKAILLSTLLSASPLLAAVVLTLYSQAWPALQKGSPVWWAGGSGALAPWGKGGTPEEQDLWQLAQKMRAPDGPPILVREGSDGQQILVQEGPDGQLVEVRQGPDGEPVLVQQGPDGEPVLMRQSPDGQLVEVQPGPDGELPEWEVAPIQEDQFQADVRETLNQVELEDLDAEEVPAIIEEEEEEIAVRTPQQMRRSLDAMHEWLQDVNMRLEQLQEDVPEAQPTVATILSLVADAQDHIDGMQDKVGRVTPLEMQGQWGQMMLQVAQFAEAMRKLQNELPAGVAPLTLVEVTSMMERASQAVKRIEEQMDQLRKLGEDQMGISGEEGLRAPKSELEMELEDILADAFQEEEGTDPNLLTIAESLDDVDMPQLLAESRSVVYHLWRCNQMLSETAPA